MENVVLVIHLILALAIIGLVLIQRSEGGGLGIGGGSGGMGGLATPRGTASVLTRMTTFFGFCFFITSITLAILAGTHNNQDGILDTYSNEPTVTQEAPAPAVPLGGESSEDKAEAVEEIVDEVAPEIEAEPDVIETQEKPSVPIGN